MGFDFEEALSGWGDWIRKRLSLDGYDSRSRPDEKLISPGKVRILAIDGGGVRGVIPAVVLGELERRLQEATGRKTLRLADRFDLIAGTSAGGVLALSMAAPDAEGRPRHSAQDLIDMYVSRIGAALDADLFSEIRSVGTRKYSSDGLQSLYADFLGKARLSDALREVLITSYSLDTGQAKFFKRRRARIDPYEDFYMRQVALATSSAPTYFAPAVFGDLGGGPEHGYIDGGIIANNPALCAVTEARRLFPEANDVVVVSLGTGYRHDQIDHKKAANWGSLQWARPLVDLLIDGPRAAVDHQLRELLTPAPEKGARYFRFQVPLAAGETTIDDASPKNLKRLKQRATSYLGQSPTVTMMEQLIPLLT